MDIHPSRRTPRVPQHRSPPLPKPATASAVFPKGYRYVSIALGPYSSFYLCAPRPSISLILDPPTRQAPSAVPMLPMAKLIMHRHVRIGFFRFPFVDLAHKHHAFSLLFPDDALHPPSSPPPTRIRRRITVSTSGHHFPSLQIPPAVHYYLSMQVEHVHNASSPNPSHTHQHHCGYCYDYDLSGVARLLL